MPCISRVILACAIIGACAAAMAADKTTLVIVYDDGRTQEVHLDQSSANIARLEYRPDGAGVVPVLAPVSSGFHADAEGWRVVSLGDNGPYGVADPTVYEPKLEAAGGNPGGHLSSGDPDGGSFYWDAPKVFLGDKRGFYGGELCYDMISEGGELWTTADIAITGGGITLVYRLTADPGPKWQTFRAPLVPAGWKRDNLNGAPAGEEDMRTVLGALTSIRLRGEYRWGAETSRLDNVCLLPPK